MLSELQQKDVWEGWIGAEIRANFFASRCAYYQTQQKVLTWLILVFSSGAAVSFLANGVPEWVKPTLALLTAAVSIFSLVQQNQKRSTDCADLHFRWNRLGSEYKALWDDFYSPDSPSKLQALEEKEAELSKSSTVIPNDERAMLKWQDYVQRQHGLASAL